MKIHFAQSGGLVGNVRETSLDTSTLPAEEAAQVERLVRDSRLPATGAFFSQKARDLRQYEITIEDGQNRVAVAFDDETLPASAKPLVGWLKKAAKPGGLR